VDEVILIRMGVVAGFCVHSNGSLWSIIYWLVSKSLLASQEGLCAIELLSLSLKRLIQRFGYRVAVKQTQCLCGSRRIGSLTSGSIPLGEYDQWYCDVPTVCHKRLIYFVPSDLIPNLKKSSIYLLKCRHV